MAQAFGQLDRLAQNVHRLAVAADPVQDEPEAAEYVGGRLAVPSDVLQGIG